METAWGEPGIGRPKSSARKAGHAYKSKTLIRAKS